MFSFFSSKFLTKQTNKKKNPTIIIGEFLVLYSMHILFYGGLGHVVLIDSKSPCHRISLHY